MNRLKYMFSVVLASTFIIGCGDGDLASETTDITIERGPVIGAFVVDDNGMSGYNLGKGKYRFYKKPAYPIVSYGGYIDVNRDGSIDKNDTPLNIDLSISSSGEKKVTILTTLAQDEDIKNYITSTYGLSEYELFNLLPSTSLIVSAISDELLKYCITNNATLEDITLTILQGLEEDIQTLISSNLLSNDSLIDIVRDNEIALVNDLNITLGDANLTLVQDEINRCSKIETKDPNNMVNSYPLYDLTQTQIDDLKFMYQEEKVARDIYIKMYELWNLRIFNSISKAEQTHMDAVKSILIKYSIEIPVLSDTIGDFDDTHLQSLYNTLLTDGSISSNDALKVGKLIEETDIADLQEKIIDAPDDIKTVYERLLNGSFNHLNAFTKRIN